MGVAADEYVAGTRGIVRGFGDPDGRWVGLMGVMAGPIEVVSALTRGTDDRPAWQIMRDPDSTPDEFVGWLEQHVGVIPVPGSTLLERRARIKDPFGFGEATKRAMVAEVALTLTGSKAVRVLTHVDDLWSRMTVVTRTAETPDADATFAAALRQKPAGVKLTHVISDFALFEDGTASFNSVDESFDTATITDVTA